MASKEVKRSFGNPNDVLQLRPTNRAKGVSQMEIMFSSRQKTTGRLKVVSEIEIMLSNKVQQIAPWALMR